LQAVAACGPYHPASGRTFAACRLRLRSIVKAARSIACLTIAGSDSGGGAGIQADLKTFAALGVHGTTALTAQNTQGVTAVHPVPAKHLAAELDAVFDDFNIAAVKTGMLGDARTVRVV